MGLEKHLQMLKAVNYFREKVWQGSDRVLNYITQRKKPAAIANIEKALNI